jgi:hydrophobic/amphiphilic exporter-1 (mainly G- bacteria), HAE1 family
MHGGHRRQRGGLVGILASTLTHIAVFVPLLFLAGVSSILFKQLSIVVIFSLRCRCSWPSRSCRCSARGCSSCRRPAEAARGTLGRLFTRERGPSTARRRLPPDCCTRRCSTARPCSPAARAVRRSRSCSADDRLRADAADRRGRGPVDVELPVGTRIERTDAVVLRSRRRSRDEVPEAVNIITNAAGAAGSSAAPTHRGSIEHPADLRSERQRSSDEIAMMLRRPAVGHAGRHRRGPGVGRQLGR